MSESGSNYQNNEKLQEGGVDNAKDKTVKEETYDDWNPSGTELFLHSEYFEDEPGSVSGIDGTWVGIADDDALWEDVQELDEIIIGKSSGKSGEREIRSLQFEKFVRRQLGMPLADVE